MMHESKGQCIGKAPSLHLFHTTVRCMKATNLGSYLIATYKAHVPKKLLWEYNYRQFVRPNSGRVL